MAHLASLTDALVSAAANGDADARAQVLGILEPRVRMMTAARLSPAPAHLDAVDDIVQEVMLSLVHRLGTLHGRTVEGLNAFVSGIVTRQVALHIRQRHKPAIAPRTVVSLDSTVAVLSNVGPLWQFLSGDRTTPSRAIDRAEQLGRLIAALGRLKPEQREAITLRIFDDLKTATVAELMGISPAAASMLIIRALRALRRELTKSTTDGGPHDGD